MKDKSSDMASHRAQVPQAPQIHSGVKNNRWKVASDTSLVLQMLATPVREKSGSCAHEVSDSH